MGQVGPLLCPVVIGRDELLEFADRAIRAAAQGHGTAVMLSGQAGLGKTRLIGAIARKAKAAGLRVDGGSVAPQDRQVPLASIREMATGMRGNPAFGSLSEDLLAIDGRHAGDALASRRLIVRSAADRILDAIDRPTLLVFDDLHWTDEVSLEVIGELARHAEGRPLLLLGGYRADEFPRGTIHREWRARLLSQRQAQELALRPLSLEETGVMTTLLLGGELPAPSDVVEAVYERTNGIPLHVEELIAALDDPARRDGRRIREAGVPDTIGDAVLVRLAGLSPEARQVASAGAVIGRCFTPDVISGVVGVPLAELEPSLEQLVDAAILHPFDYIDRGYYDFRHQLLRDAVYAAVPPSQRRRYHEQAAEFVMTLDAASIVHASTHYERAGLRAQAFRASLAAAREASRISARHEAYELYQRAVANMPADLPIVEQADLYEQYSDAAGAIERNEDASTAAARARELYLDAGRPLQAAVMLVGMSIGDVRNGAPNATVLEYVDRAIAETLRLPVTPEREEARAWLLGLRATHLFFASDLRAARETAVESRRLGESVGDRGSILEADLLLARIAIVEGDLDRGMEAGMRAARAARDAGFEAVGVTGYRNLAVLAARVMDPAAAEVAIGEGLQYADAIEQSHCRQMMSTTRAILDWAGGRWDDADRRARQELVEIGCRRGVLGSLDVIGLVALGRGQLDEARRWLDESLASGRSLGEAQYLMTPLWGLAEADLLAGAAARAVERCEEALTLAIETGERALFIPFVATGTRACEAARRPEAAEAWLERARRHLSDWKRAAPALDHAEGLVRLAAGSTVSARASLERAVNGWQELGRIWEATWAQLDLAACLVRGNRHLDALPLLAEARRAGERVGSAPVLERARELERAARRRGLAEQAWRPLSAREFEVARFIANGLTNSAIAAELTLSSRTVGAHVEHILAKLGATRRAEIAAWVATVDQPTPAARG